MGAIAEKILIVYLVTLKIKFFVKLDTKTFCIHMLEVPWGLTYRLELLCWALRNSKRQKRVQYWCASSFKKLMMKQQMDCNIYQILLTSSYVFIGS